MDVSAAPEFWNREGFEGESDEALAKILIILSIEAEEIDIDAEFEKESEKLDSSSSDIDRLIVVMKWMNANNACKRVKEEVE
jgi:hypothetical protein